jgi:hypothetical protein
MPEDTILYVFQDNNGKWLATLTAEEARVCVTPAFHRQTIEVLTLRALYERDAHALVRARAQFYWAEDLMRGRAQGVVI